VSRPKSPGFSLSFLRLAPVAVLVSVLAACGHKAPPPAPPPVVVIPPQPRPPMGAPENMTIPELATDGTRHTVNSDLSTQQTVWNFRSAFNVAALNCIDPKYAPILASYKHFLKVHDKALDKANAALTKDFKSSFGTAGMKTRESYQTQVYNYFAIPPVTASFCDAAVLVANDVMVLPAGQLEGYAPQGLARLEAPFKSFFDAYDQYRSDLIAWQARYGGIVVVAPGQGGGGFSTR